VRVPAGQVRYPGEDVQQAALQQPLVNRLLQGDRGGSAVGALALLEHRSVGLQYQGLRLPDTRRLSAAVRLNWVR
jgi:hypothetical protein